MVEDVIINFTIGENEVQPTLDKLSKDGAKGFSGLSSAMQKTATDSKALVEDFKRVNTSVLQVGASAKSINASPLVEQFKRVASTAVTMGKSVETAFGEGVQDALAEAGVSMEEFTKALTDAGSPAKSLAKTTDDLIKSFTKGGVPAGVLEEKISGLKNALLISKTSFSNLQKEITKTAPPTNALTQEVIDLEKNLISAADTTKLIEEQITKLQDALNRTPESNSLKQELKELKEDLAEAKLSGNDTGEEFDRLRARAGELSDAIADAGSEIKNAGSDTKNLDNVVGSISALASGYAAVQGVAALFGEENENVQKTLIKVNAAMSVASGIQGFYNATLKEGSLAKLADSVQSKTAAAGQAIYTTAVGTSTGALKLFRIALLATGIGAIVALLVLAANAMGVFGDATEDATVDLKAQKEAAEELVSSLEEISGASATARAAQKGGIDDLKRQIELAKAKGTESLKSTQSIYELEQELRRKEINELKTLGKTYQQAYATRKQLGTLNAAEEELLNNKITETYKAALDKQNEITASGFEFTREQAEKAKALAEKAEQEAKERAAKRREAIIRQLNDELAILQRKLLFVEKGGAEELEIQKDIINKQRDIDLQAEKITLNQKRLLRARAYDERLKLDEAFNKRATELQLNAQLQTNEAILAGVAIGNEKRLQLQIENINTQAQLEINAAEGNATKILLIEAKKIADIRALKNASIDADFAKEIEGSKKTNDIIIAGLSKIADSTKESVAVRIAAAEGIGRQELVNVDRAIRANELKEQSDEDYQATYKRLADERAAIEQGTADKIVEINKSANEQKKLDFQEAVELSLQLGQMASDFFSNLAQLSADREQANIERQKRELQELEEAGAISAKNAEIRSKQIEIQERAAKNRQAQREKQVAVFNALLAIPQAYLAGLKSGPQGLVLGPIFALIAAAQAALVIARPVPKFFRGKQPGTYEGPGIVADMGPEIVERGGRMFLYTKPTETHLGRYDKVHTAAQARAIMHSTKINTTVAAPVAEKLEIDYNKMPKSNVSINIEKDFIRESVAEGLQMNRYFNNRYKF